TIRTMRALVPIVPMKSSIASSLEAMKLYPHACHSLEWACRSLKCGGLFLFLLLVQLNPVNYVHACSCLRFVQIAELIEWVKALWRRPRARRLTADAILALRCLLGA